MDKAKCNKSIFCHENVFKYAKQAGVASYAGLGISISQPTMMRFGQLDLTNAFLVGSLAGTGAFLYSRNHMQNVPTKKRIWLSVYGSGLFNLGSILIWAIVKAATQDFNLHPIFRGFLSLAASYYMIQSGLSWIDIVDKNN